MMDLRNFRAMAVLPVLQIVLLTALLPAVAEAGNGVTLTPFFS